MLVSGDVGGPLILASSCLVIVYFFWPEIDCSRGRWICPWTFFSLSHSFVFFFSKSWCSAKVIMLSLHPHPLFSPLIYFRLQSSSIAGCTKCVVRQKKKEIRGLDVTAWRLERIDGHWPSWTENIKAGWAPSTCVRTHIHTKGPLAGYAFSYPATFTTR